MDVGKLAYRISVAATLAVSLCILLLIVSCGNGDEREAANEPDAKPLSSEVAEDSQSPGDDMTAHSEMAALKQETMKRLDELDKRMSGLSARLDAATIKGKAMLQSELGAARASWAKTKDEAASLKDAGAQAWRDAKPHLENALNETGQALDEVKKQLDAH